MPTAVPAFAGAHQPKPLAFDPTRLDGLSEKLIRSHWENNYQGSVKTLNMIEGRLASAMTDKDLPPVVYGGLKREELHRTGSVILHELYFEQLGGNGQASGSIRDALTASHGSFEAWEAEFRRTAMALAGARAGPSSPGTSTPTRSTTTGPGITPMVRSPARRCWCSTCTSTPSTWTMVRRRRNTSTPSCAISTGPWSRGGSTPPPAQRRDPMKWVTRERPKIDRIACPWLIRRFIEPDAEFLYVPAPQVLVVAEAEGATPYDIPDVEFSHVGDKCSFDAFLAKYSLDDPALLQLAEIVRGADTSRLDLTPQSAGLFALSLGLSANFADDHEMLEHGMVMYDALYAWCRSCQAEAHRWPPDMSKQAPQ